MTIEDLVNANLWDKSKGIGLKAEEARVKSEAVFEKSKAGR